MDAFILSGRRLPAGASFLLSSGRLFGCRCSVDHREPPIQPRVYLLLYNRLNLSVVVVFHRPLVAPLASRWGNPFPEFGMHECVKPRAFILTCGRFPFATCFLFYHWMFVPVMGVFNAVCGAIYGLLGSAFLTLLACHYWPAYGPRFIDCWLLKLECMWTADFMPSACCFAVNVGVPSLASNHCSTAAGFV